MLENITLKPAETSFRQGWKEALKSKTKPISELQKFIENKDVASIRKQIKSITTIMLIFIIGCTGQIVEKKNNTAAMKQTGQNEYFRVTFSEQGGFTGGYESYTIDQNGNIIKTYRLPGRKTSEDSLGTILQKSLDSLKTTIETSNFFQIEYKKRGNMTYSIEVQKDTLRHKVSWPAGDRKVPHNLQQIQRTLRSLVRKTEKNVN